MPVRWTALAVDRDLAAVEVEHQHPDLQARLAEALAAADHRLDARHQFRRVERLADEIVRAEGEGLDLRLWPGDGREYHDRRVDPPRTHPPDDIVAVHVRQLEVEQDDVVIVVAGEFEQFLAGLRLVHDGAALAQHGRNKLGCWNVIATQ